MSEIERAIEHIADNVRFLQTHDYADNSLQAHELALTALKEKLDRERNEPLTVDQLKEGIPVYLHFTDGYSGGHESGWYLVEHLLMDDECVFSGIYEEIVTSLLMLGITYFAYRYEPKGEKA